MENTTPPEPSAAPPVHPVPTPSVAIVSEKDARMWAMWCHLSALSGFVGIPFGNVVGPLIIWQLKKDQIPSPEAHGKEAVNFQLSFLIYLVAGGVAAFVGSFICIGFLLIP